METKSRLILQNTMRFLSNKGYQVISEFALPNKKRVNLIALNLKKDILDANLKNKIEKFIINRNNPFFISRLITDFHICCIKDFINKNY